jgi:hypothetical protein
MKRAWIILVAGLLAGAAGYSGLYFASTSKSRCLEHCKSPELAWLKAEFNLNDAEYARICEMHKGYMAGCAERCRRIDEKNAHLKHLLASTNAITPEIEKTLAEAAELRGECQKEMLRHFYEVSRTMPPEQGKRYLAWVQERTIGLNAHAQMAH